MAKKKVNFENIVIENEQKNTEKLFSVLHIFGFGKTQLISKESNKQVDSTSLTKLQPVINEILSKNPNDNSSDYDNNYHAINIFNDSFVDFLPKTKEQKSFRVKYSELNKSLIEELVEEIKAINLSVE